MTLPFLPQSTSLARVAVLAVAMTWSAGVVAQTTYWLGRIQGTNYVFDVPLEAEFAQKVLAANPAQYLVDKNPRDLPSGSVPLAKATFTYDLPMLKRGSVAVERKSQDAPYLWIHDHLNKPAGAPLLAQLPVPAAGQWAKASVVMAIAPDARPLNLNVPVPVALQAQNRMVALVQQTRPGRFYPQVKVPADLDGYRQQMLIYGNAGRRDPDFRKANGSRTVLDLSRDTQDTYADQSKTRMNKEQVYRVNSTPPYFTDHVMDAKLNDAAQFQAEYNASIEQATHDGPRSFVDPATGKSADMTSLGKRADFFGVRGLVEGAGAAPPGGAPHNWMTSDTHFRPFFNVGGCHDQIGYGAAQGLSGMWYFVMVPTIDKNPTCVRTGGVAAQLSPSHPLAAPVVPTPQPTTGTTQLSPSHPLAAPVTVTGGDLPLRGGTRLEPGRRYRSASGQAMVFQPDGNLVVYDAAGGYVWGLDKLPNFRQIKTVELQADGNLVARGGDGGFIWSALSRDPDASATLSISPSGALQLVSGRTGATLWASDGRTGAAPAAQATAGGSASVSPPLLEVGKQYALRDRDVFRYVKLAQIHNQRYLFAPCPNPPADGVPLDPKAVMRVEDALALKLKQARDPCDVSQVPFGR